jgi:proline racemase
MNANELADKLQLDKARALLYADTVVEAAAMLRQQQAQIAKYKQALESIANEQVELSHDKIKWQNEDHIKWAKEALK